MSNRARPSVADFCDCLCLRSLSDSRLWLLSTHKRTGADPTREAIEVNARESIIINNYLLYTCERYGPRTDKSKALNILDCSFRRCAT